MGVCHSTVKDTHRPVTVIAQRQSASATNGAKITTVAHHDIINTIIGSSDNSEKRTAIPGSSTSGDGRDGSESRQLPVASNTRTSATTAFTTPHSEDSIRREVQSSDTVNTSGDSIPPTTGSSVTRGTGASSVDLLDAHSISSEEDSDENIDGSELIAGVRVYNEVDDITRYLDIRQQIGRGSFAAVHLAMCRDTKKKFAVKVLDKSNDEKEVEYFREECRLMTMVRRQRNVCKIHRLYETSTHIYAAMDFCEGGNLLEMALKSGTRSEKETARIVRDVAAALVHIHQHGIAHRDIKLENVVCVSAKRSYPVKLIDFGLAKAFRYTDETTGEEVQRMLHSACGSPLYVAPEIVARAPYTTSIDIWGLGVIAYSLISGMNPFYLDGVSNTVLYRRIARGIYTFGSRFNHVSRECRKFLCRLLCVHPRDRLTALQILQHPWILCRGDMTKFRSRNELAADRERKVSTPSVHLRRIEENSPAASIPVSHSQNQSIAMGDVQRPQRAGQRRQQVARATTPGEIARRLSAF